MILIDSSPLDNGEVPVALRRCVERTLLRFARSLIRGRPISGPNLRRLFERRWHTACVTRDFSATDEAMAWARATLVSGRDVLRRRWREASPR